MKSANMARSLTLLSYLIIELERSIIFGQSSFENGQIKQKAAKDGPEMGLEDENR